MSQCQESSYTKQDSSFAEPISDSTYSALCLILLPSEVMQVYPLRALDMLAEPTRFVAHTHETAFDAIVQGNVLSDRSLRLLACDCAEWVSSAASSAAVSAADSAASSAAVSAASSAACQTLSFFLSHYLRLELVP